MKAACSCLMGLVLLALLCLGQPDVPAFANSEPSSATISQAQHRDAVALLRVNGKVQGLEARTGRPASAKFVNGNPGALPPEAGLVFLTWESPVKATEAAATWPCPQASANQPRAPPLG